MNGGEVYKYILNLHILIHIWIKMEFNRYVCVYSYIREAKRDTYFKGMVCCARDEGRTEFFFYFFV